MFHGYVAMQDPFPWFAANAVNPYGLLIAGHPNIIVKHALAILSAAQSMHCSSDGMYLKSACSLRDTYLLMFCSRLRRSRMKMKTLAILVNAALFAMANPVMADQGPSTTTAPYMQNIAAGVKFTSILTTGDIVGGYKMGGIPDGLGAYDNHDGTFTLLTNHENFT